MRHATTASASAPVPSWRLAVLIAVLAGFFLMHGTMVGDSCAGLGSPSLAAPAAHAAPAMSAPANTSAHPATAVTVADECGCPVMGAACTPLRPQADGALLALVLAGYASTLFGGAPALSSLTAAARLLSRRTPRAAPVRAWACVSRT